MSSAKSAARQRSLKLAACAELERLLERRNQQPSHARQIDGEIHRRFCHTRAVFVLDMASFSLSVQRHGIIHHLAKIHRMREIAGHAVAVEGGAAVKFEADNCFATFPTTRAAVKAAMQVNAALQAANQTTSEDDAIHVSIGIGYGPILLACDELFGDEVNLASKLGEDIAQSGEVLLTDRARRALRGRGFRFEQVEMSISGIHLRAARLLSR
jgi:adenylate cyclase